MEISESPRAVEVAWAELSTQVGPLVVMATRLGLIRVAFGSAEAVLASAAASVPLTVVASVPSLAVASRELEEFFAGHRQSFDVELDWRLTSGLQREVLQTLHRTVAFGATVSYQELAVRCGRPTAARVVGAIMGSNPLAIVVPCHRVIASGGGLGGYGGGLDAKVRLLTLEGVLQPSLLDGLAE